MGTENVHFWGDRKVPNVQVHPNVDKLVFKRKLSTRRTRIRQWKFSVRCQKNVGLKNVHFSVTQNLNCSISFKGWHIGVQTKALDETNKDPSMKTFCQVSEKCGAQKCAFFCHLNVDFSMSFKGLHIGVQMKALDVTNKDPSMKSFCQVSEKCGAKKCAFFCDPKRKLFNLL